MLLKTQSSQIPQNPGVYFFKKGEKILYIGKAANLRSRLRSYLNLQDIGRPFGRPMSKTLALLKEADSLSWEVLGSEAEALIREAELIKKYRPKYNVLMRDDKQYFFVGFTKETFPRIFITHQPAKQTKIRNPKSEIRNKPETKNPKLKTSNFVLRASNFSYIGPFTEGGVLRSVLKTLRRAFPYCTCKQFHKRLCLNAKIGRCLGFCCLRTSENLMSKVAASGSLSELYQKNISAIKQILSGKNQSLTRSLKIEMKKLSSEQKYEEAGILRDKIRSLTRIFEHRSVIRKDMPAENNRAIKELETLLKISEIQRIEAYDIANIHGKFAYGSMAVFANGALQKNDYRIFKINTVTGSDDPKMIAEIISRRFKHPEWQYPQVIIVDGGKQQLNAALAAVSHIKFVALTKNSRHAGDHIFISRIKNPIPLSKLPESLKNLILLLDSEAHRFAIAHYRKSHRKNLFS